ncbi:MAG TPA: hypothetical protein VF172_08150 [Nitrososphaera sp.]|jgi:hypothetical protein
MSDNEDGDDDHDDGLAAELDAILDYYEKNEAGQDVAVDEKQQQEFLAKFERIKVEVIKPTMERIGNYLEKRGHSYQIKDETSIHYDNPTITMEIYPRTASDLPVQEHEFPTIAFIAEPDISAIGIEVRDGMPGRPGLTRGHTTSLDSLTQEYVKSQIVTVIKMNFAKRFGKNNSRSPANG